jgi:hypothetical protein
VLRHLQKCSYASSIKNREKKVTKGAWGMPRLSEAKKDVISCDKLGGFANRN